jgi:hypothetical protein
LPTFSDERSRRLWAAAEVQSLGRGGFNSVCAVTSMGYFTIKKGLKELKNIAKLPQRLRKIGGRKKNSAKDETFLRDLQLIVAPLTRGDTMKPLQRTSKSLAKIKLALEAKGYDVGVLNRNNVKRLFKGEAYCPYRLRYRSRRKRWKVELQKLWRTNEI